MYSFDSKLFLKGNGQMHILIAEDQQMPRIILATHLREWGYRVTETSNGIEALDYLVSHNCDIDMLITDWNMPVMKGLELARKVRALSETFQYVYIIMLTTKGEGGDILKGFEEGGINDYVMKPFEANELYFRIRVGDRLVQAERSQRNYSQHLEKIVHEQTRTIRETQDKIIKRVFSALESYDQETRNHIRRIGAMGAYLSKIMGLPIEVVDAMHTNASIHDMGEIRIPDTMLFQPDPLGSEKFEKRKENTLLGAKVFGSQNLLIHLAEKITCAHHENGDNSDHPHGFVGEEISLESRIVAVLDVYDALLSDRVYRKAVPEEEALVYIIRMRGIKFDPDVCDAFLAHIDQIRTIRKNVDNIKNSASEVVLKS